MAQHPPEALTYIELGTLTPTGRLPLVAVRLAEALLFQPAPKGSGLPTAFPEAFPCGPPASPPLSRPGTRVQPQASRAAPLATLLRGAPEGLRSEEHTSELQSRG